MVASISIISSDTGISASRPSSDTEVTFAVGTTLYGQLLVAKVLIFLAMVVLASFNRYLLTPALEVAIERGEHAAAVGALRRSLGMETACAVIVLALVGWLGTLEPIASSAAVS